MEVNFLRGLDEFLAKLCQHDNYSEPAFHEVDEVRHLSSPLNETEVMLALSKNKKIKSGPDNILIRNYKKYNKIRQLKSLRLQPIYKTSLL